MPNTNARALSVNIWNMKLKRTLRKDPMIDSDEKCHIYAISEVMNSFHSQRNNLKYNFKTFTSSSSGEEVSNFKEANTSRCHNLPRANKKLY